MQTNPATAPLLAPRTVGFFRINHSVHAQAVAPAAAEKWVTANALPAIPSDASSLPALNPNQPNHRMAAPSAVYVIIKGFYPLDFIWFLHLISSISLTHSIHCAAHLLCSRSRTNRHGENHSSS